MTHWAILTGEYPPQPGGVGDYTRLVAGGLAAAGDRVTVYAPPHRGPDERDEGVVVRRLPDHFGLGGLAFLDAELAARPRPSRVLIQYVPHAYGMKAMNLPFAAWVAARAWRFAPVWVMFHEVAAPAVSSPPMLALLGAVTRATARLVAGAAERVFVSIPAWGDVLGRICPRSPRVEWSPVPCNVHTEADPAAVSAVRARLVPHAGTVLAGHFGTFGRPIGDLIGPTAVALVSRNPSIRFVFMGRNSVGFRDTLATMYPSLASRIVATGDLTPAEVSAHLRACDFLVQPYPDGITCRRGSVMAAMANGVPVVSNLGHLSESMWQGLGCVSMAPEPDTAAILAAASALLILDANRRGEMGRLGSDLYKRMFSLDMTVARLRSVRAS